MNNKMNDRIQEIVEDEHKQEVFIETHFLRCPKIITKLFNYRTFDDFRTMSCSRNEFNDNEVPESDFHNLL